VVNPGTPEERELQPLSDNNRLRQGDLLRVMTSGGGGWGHPFDRPAAQVRDDVLDGFVSYARAQQDYGVVLDPQSLTVDEVETARLRKDQRGETAMFHRGKYVL
jgi:N-methylhydantoinase B